MIKVSNLTKHYGGKRALGPVSFEISDGETVGFLGLNGAGKTTALRILACDLRPSSGRIMLGGVDAVADPHKIRARIGFVPEQPPLYQDMTVRDYLRFAAELRGTKGEAFRRRLPRVLELTSLGEVEGDIIGTLSHGFRQRVGVAQAIVHDPQFLILDEPTRGLDPVQIVEMRNLIQGLKARHTVLISSHILPEISQTCDRLLVLGGGLLLASGTEAEFTVNVGQSRQVVVGIGHSSGPSTGSVSAKVRAAIENVEGVAGITAEAEVDGMSRFTISTKGDVRAALARAIITAELPLVHLDYSHSELESSFIRMVGAPASEPEKAVTDVRN